MSQENSGTTREIFMKTETSNFEERQSYACFEVNRKPRSRANTSSDANILHVNIQADTNDHSLSESFIWVADMFSVLTDCIW